MHISCQRCINTAGQCIQVASWLCSLFASSSSSSYPRLQGAPCQHTHTQTTASLMQLRSFLAPLAYPGLSLYLQKKFSLSVPLQELAVPIMTHPGPAMFSWQGSISNSIHVIHRYDSRLAVHTCSNTQGRQKGNPNQSCLIPAAGS